MRSTYLAAISITGVLVALPLGAADARGGAAPDEVVRLSLTQLQPVMTAKGIGDVVNTSIQYDEELGLTHARFQQRVGNVPVFGGEAIVHLDASGALSALTDDMLSDVQVDTNPTVRRANAIATAQRGQGALTAAPEADLWVLRHDGTDHLAWRVQLRREDGTDRTALPVIFVDAHSGEIVWQYDNLQTATGSGSSLYSGTVSITTLLYNGTYYMEDTTRRIGTFDNRNTTNSTYRFADADNSWTGSTQRAGVDAHYGAQRVRDYFLNVHGRNGINGSGGPGYYTSANGTTALISSVVHYGVRYNNAFWNGSYMTYGDGDGTTFSPLVTIDIAGHEMTHGVTQFTAGLIYSGESGALNEAVSDIFGAMIERYTYGQSTNTWRIGEQAYTPGVSGDALRYMATPHSAANSGFTANDDPDHYTERYTGTADNGGVHVNSGIVNNSFYLLAAGGTNHIGGSVTGIGADAAARIWYRALTSYMTSSTNFSGARTATINASTALYGSTSTQTAAVRRAWCVVGIGSCT